LTNRAGIIEVSFLLAVVSTSFALGASPADERLDEILTAMKTAGERLDTLQAVFEQTDHDHILDMDESSSGMLYVKVPGRIRWEYEAPARKVLLIKEDKIQLYIPTANQVQEFNRRQSRGAGADLLVGFGKSNAEIGKNYDAGLVEETDDTVLLALVPKPGTTASVFKAIDLTIEKKRWIPIRSVFHEANRDTTEIVFKEMEVNGSLPADAFELELPPDVEIVRNKD
jgi:outer membrane lipoprotein carrier protein